ncbi:MAG: hypothetical protein HOP11_13770 [Saprospiraceae bacterium]|nr:hypothetical protein [Saprospiraceae bacterium]
MKNLLFLVVFALLGISSAFSQDAEKDVKKADKLVGLYLLDTKTGKDKLLEAKSLIDAASKDATVAEMYKTYLVKGKVYNELAAMDNANLIINPKHKLTYDDAGIVSFESLEKALQKAVKAYEKKDALSIMQELSQYLNNFGSVLYSTSGSNSAGYLNAAKNFEGVLKINQLLKDGGQKQILETSDDMNRQKYIVAVCAKAGKSEEMSIKYFEELEASNYNDSTNAGAVVYESLYNYYSGKDEAKADNYLAKGRAKFPSESNLLFAEINSFIKKGKLSDLIDKLLLAMKKEPNNPSIVSTIANVYDNLSQKEYELGNVAKGDELQKESFNYYDKVLEMDPNNAAALYSKGAMYYNRAALVSKEVNQFANDYSAAGTKKYEAKKAEMTALFDKALPFLEKADEIEPNDINTLVALKEIYAKKGMFDKSNAAKVRLEKLKSK